MKIIKKFKKFPSGSVCMELSQNIETLGDYDQFSKELEMEEKNGNK